MGESHGTCEETGKQHGGIPRYIGNGMYEKCGSELERPYPSPKGKKRKRISLAKSYFWWEGVGEEHSTDNDCARKRSLWEGSLLHSCL